MNFDSGAVFKYMNLERGTKCGYSQFPSLESIELPVEFSSGTYEMFCAKLGFI